MSRPILAALAAGLAVSLAAGATLAAPAPAMSIQSYAQLKLPLPYPYDEKADADAAVAAGLARARGRHKLLLIDLGGNWCGDCRILAATMDLPELKAFVEAHYEVVIVDVGRFDRNLQIPDRYGALRGFREGVPSILIVDPRSNSLVDAGHVSALADARSMSPQALADWLAQWTK